MLLRGVLVAAHGIVCAGLVAGRGGPAKRRLFLESGEAWPAPSDGLDRYGEWEVDVAAVEGAAAPLVYLGESAGAGTGVFAAERLEAGATITEFVGCLAPTPGTRCDEMELQQAFYGNDGRSYSQRYEIGLSGARVADAGGAARGGVLVEDDDTMEEYCDVDEGPAACVARAGEGDFVLLGKVVAQGATPAEGVAQLINDHSAVRAPGGGGDDGAIRSGDVDGLIVTSDRSKVPLAADREALEAAVAEYIGRIERHNNVALVQARTGLGTGIAAPRVFAVATRPIEAHAELRYTYGVEWWLSQLRRAALAQLVSCAPSPARAAALASIIRDIERCSAASAATQARSIGRAGCMPRDYVAPLEPLPPLDDLLLGEDNWKRALLVEEFALATECPVERVYADAWGGEPEGGEPEGGA